MNRFEKYGFTKDEDKKEISRVFNDGRFSTIYIDTYSLEPYMLFSRVSENKVRSEVNDGRIVLRKEGKCDTVMMDVLLDNIEDCMVLSHDGSRVEFVFMIHDVCFRMIVII